MTIIVEVWGTKIELTVQQRSKSVWIASGAYNGKSFQGQGRSANTAAASWREQARYSSN